MKSILDRQFKYVLAVETDVAKTFARIRREQLKRSSQPTASVRVLERKEKRG